MNTFFTVHITIFTQIHLETSSSSSDGEQDNQSHIDEEIILDENEDDIEPLVFDESKEIYYKNKYKQTFEQVVSLDNVYILNLDAQKRYAFFTKI